MLGFGGFLVWFVCLFLDKCRSLEYNYQTKWDLFWIIGSDRVSSRSWSFDGWTHVNCLVINLNNPVWLLGIKEYCENSDRNYSKSCIAYFILSLCTLWNKISEGTCSLLTWKVKVCNLTERWPKSVSNSHTAEV